MTEEPFLTARQLAAKLAVSPGALLRWTRDGLVPIAVKLPSGAVRFRSDLLDAWLDECQIVAAGHGEGETGAAEPGVSATDARRARAGAYARVRSFSSATRSPDAATENENQEEQHG